MDRYIQSSTGYWRVRIIRSLRGRFYQIGTDGYEEIIKSAELLDQKFDAVIIDEGQDFHPDWLLEIGVEPRNLEWN